MYSTEILLNTAMTRGKLRLDFRRSLVSGSGRSAGSFPEQRLVIEPKVNSTEIDSRRDIYTGFLAITDERHGYKQTSKLSQLQTLN